MPALLVAGLTVNPWLFAMGAPWWVPALLAAPAPAGGCEPRRAAGRHEPGAPSSPTLLREAA